MAVRMERVTRHAGLVPHVLHGVAMTAVLTRVRGSWVLTPI